MSITKEKKKEIVDALGARVGASSSVVAFEYRGMTVAEITTLRAQARQDGVHLQVVKNTLARRAFVESELSVLSERLRGPLMLAFSAENPGAAARLLTQFKRDHQHCVIRAAALQGRLFDGEQEVQQLANLPTLEEALGRLAGTLNAPLIKLVQTLQAVPLKLARTLVALRDSRS